MPRLRSRVRVPFSAPEEGRSRKVLPSFRMPVHEGTRHKRPQNASSRGRGCLQGFANRSRAARVRVPFSAPRQKGESLGILLFCFCMPAHGGLGTCDLKTPLPWAGGVCKVSRNRSRAARVRVPFSALRVRRKDEQRTDQILESFVYQRYTRLFLLFPHSC